MFIVTSRGDNYDKTDELVIKNIESMKELVWIASILATRTDAESLALVNIHDHYADVHAMLLLTFTKLLKLAKPEQVDDEYLPICMMDLRNQLKKMKLATVWETVPMVHTWRQLLSINVKYELQRCPTCKTRYTYDGHLFTVPKRNQDWKATVYQEVKRRVNPCCFLLIEKHQSIEYTLPPILCRAFEGAPTEIEGYDVLATVRPTGIELHMKPLSNGSLISRMMGM